MWEQLVTKNLLLPADDKDPPHMCIPCLKCKSQMSVVCDPRPRLEEQVLQETVHAEALWNILERNPCREVWPSGPSGCLTRREKFSDLIVAVVAFRVNTSAVLMQSIAASSGSNASCRAEVTVNLLHRLFDAVIARLEKGRGKKPAAVEDSLSWWRSLQEKVTNQEQCARSLLDRMDTAVASAARTSEPTPKRRRRQKGGRLEEEQSQQAPPESVGACPFAGMPRTVIDVLYEYKMPELPEFRTRKYAKQRYAAQNLSKSIQAAVLDHTIDLDIENCSFVLMYQLLNKLQPLHPLWAKANQVLRMCAQERSTVIEQHLQTYTCKGKVVMQKIFNGGKIPTEYAKNKFCADLQKTSVLCRWAAATAIPDAYAELLQIKDRAEVSVLTYLWNVAEDTVIDAWLEKILPLSPEHVSLHFDGIRVDKQTVGSDVERFCQECAQHIEDRTGFKVSIRQKIHRGILAVIQERGERADVECPDSLLVPGNCILASLYSLGFHEQALAMQDRREHPHQQYFERRGHRTYEQVAQGCDVRLFPRLDFDGAKAVVDN